LRIFTWTQLENPILKYSSVLVHGAVIPPNLVSCCLSPLSTVEMLTKCVQLGSQCGEGWVSVQWWTIYSRLTSSACWAKSVSSYQDESISPTLLFFFPLFFFFFWDRDSLCNPGWPQTHNLSVSSASQMLGFLVLAEFYRPSLLR
jgi:hypothetical protein